MAFKKDLTGKKFGYFEVISFDHMHGKKSYWNCKCICGKIISVRSDNLQRKKNPITSCGCKSNRFHGDYHTRLNRIFNGMKRRCNNPNDERFSHYGGRGIKVEWNSYIEFKNDMYESYLEHVKLHGEESTTIERVNVNGNYCKGNCIWTDMTSQARNRTNTNYVLCNDGSRIPISEFCEINGYNYNTLRNRYRCSEYNGTHEIPENELIKNEKDDDIV